MFKVCILNDGGWRANHIEMVSQVEPFKFASVIR